MLNRKLCPKCETGRDTYLLDGRSSECPYLYCHNGRKCGMYKKLHKPKRAGILRCFMKRVFVTPPPRKMSL